MGATVQPERSPGGGGTPSSGAHWDLVTCDPSPPGPTGVAAHPGARNMALDELLLRRVAAGGPPALRFYRWAPACLSMGRSQPAAGRVDTDAAARHGVDIVRRPTGGLAVLHHLELTYAVALPVGLLGSPRQTYRALCSALAAGLRRIGVPAVVVGDPARPALPSRGPLAAPPSSVPIAAPPFLRADYLADAGAQARCFAAAAPGEIAVGGRKLVGSAQRREGRVLLQHGSILMDGRQDLVAQLFGPGQLRPASPPITLREVLGEAPPAGAVAASLARGFEDVLGIGLAPAPLDAEGRAALGPLEARYRSEEWTWRR